MFGSAMAFTMVSPGLKTRRARVATNAFLPNSRTLLAAALWALVIVGWPSCSLASNRILSIRHWVAPDQIRVVIDTLHDALFSTENENRKLIVHLENTAFPGHISAFMSIHKPGLESVAISSRAPSGVDVVLSLTGEVQATVFKLKRFQDKPYRIVIDIILPDVARQESDARKGVKIFRKDRIVVIDPGHGGEDVGAVGRGGTFEKDVVLSIGIKLRDLLNSRPGYRAFLTREGDYYLSFNKRRMIAREYGADLFVSVHADAARNREAFGSSVYCLSTGGASSEAAKIMARNENLADIVGGVPNGEGSDASDPIILDMFQTHTLNQSKTFGGVLLGHLKAVNHLKFKVIQEAPLHVLKLPEIPSVLIETAYISNATEEKLLKISFFQERIASVVAKAVGEFLPPLPPVAQSGQASRGEVIAEIIAAKEAGINRVADGKPTKKNGNHAPEKAGENLSKANAGMKAPVSEAKIPPGDKTEWVVYRVRKGDTLASIAKRHGTTAPALARANRLKLSKPLYVDRKLVIPGEPAR